MHTSEKWKSLEHIASNPLHHDELIARCDMHFVYMGFGIFLCLVRQPPTVPDINILGTIHSDNPATLNKLISSTQGVIGMTKSVTTVTTSTANSVAGSTTQLSWVESELKAKSTKPVKPVKPAETTKSAKLAQPTAKPSQGVIRMTK